MEQFIDMALKLMLLVLSGVIAYFWGEIKELRRKNDEQQKEASQKASDLQREIADVRETFVSLETLRETEGRITHYFDTRLADMLGKLEAKMDMIVQLMKKE